MHRSDIRAQSEKQDQGGGFAVGRGERIGAPEISCVLIWFMNSLCQSLGNVQNQPASQRKIVAGVPEGSDSRSHI